MRTVERATMVLVALVLAGCGGENAEGPDGLREAIERGDTCAELFEIRNEIDPKSKAYEEAPGLLRAIGCYNSSATRTDGVG